VTRRRLSPQTLGAILYLVAALGWVLGGLPRVAVGSGVDSFLPADDPTITSLGELADSFGGDAAVVVLRTGGSTSPLDEEHLEELLRLEGTLASLPDVAVTYGPATTLNQTVIRVQQLLAELSGRRDALREAHRTEAAERFDRRYGALVVRGLPGGLPTLRNQTFVHQVLFGSDDVPEPRWAHFVPNPGTVAIYVRPRKDLDQDAATRLTTAIEDAVDDSALGATDVTITGAPVVTAELAEQGRSELPRLGAGALAAVAVALFLVPWTRRRSRRLLPLVPMGLATLMTLAWFGWRDDPVSLGAIAFLPVILGVGSYYPVYLAQRGHRRLVLSVAGAAAAAFATLTLSPLPFVRDLGVAITVGIGLVVLNSLLLAPLLGVETRLPEPAATQRAGTPRPSRLRLAVVGLLSLVAAAGWAVLPDVQVQTDPQQMIDGLPAFERAEEVERQLGFSGELDIVLSGNDVLTPEALAWLRSAESGVVTRHGDHVRPIVSAAELLAFLGDSPSQEQVDAAMRLLPSYLSGAAVTSDRHHALISLGGDWDSLSGDPDLVPSIERALPEPPPGYDVTVTGLPVAVVRGYELVSDSRYPANLIGIGAAGLVLALALSRRRDALAALAAAAIATGAGVFAAWALGFSLNPLTLALGPLTAAAGCEFAVLLSEARRTGDAVLRRSVLLAAGLSAAGYGVLTLSGLPVVHEFGIALVASLGLALVSAFAVVGTGRVHRGGEADPTPVHRSELETSGA